MQCLWKTRVLSLCIEEIWHGLAWDRTWASVVRGRWRTASGTEHTNFDFSLKSIFSSAFYIPFYRRSRLCWVIPLPHLSACLSSKQKVLTFILHLHYCVYWRCCYKSWRRYIYIGVHKFSKKSGSHLKILGARRVTLSKFLTEEPQILGTTVQN
jgi:hypothetical protein